MLARRIGVCLLLAALAVLLVDAVKQPAREPGLDSTRLGGVFQQLLPLPSETEARREDSARLAYLDLRSGSQPRTKPKLPGHPASALFSMPVWLALGIMGFLLYALERMLDVIRNLYGLTRSQKVTNLDGASANIYGRQRLIGLFMIWAGFFALIVEPFVLRDVGAGSTNLTIAELWAQAHPSSFEDVAASIEIDPDGSAAMAFALLRLPVFIVITLVGLFVVFCRNAPVQSSGVRTARNDPAAPGTPATHDAPDHAPRSELGQALSSCRTAFLGIGLFSGVINLLMLTGAFFMLQIYDRVLPSRSVPTLVGLAILAGCLFLALGVLDMIRARVLARIGGTLDEALSDRVYDAIVRLPLRSASKGDGMQPVRDLDAIRTFLSSQGPTALFDLPWLPLYLGIIFALHPMLGLTALIGAIVLVSLTLMTETLTRRPTKAATGLNIYRTGLAEASRRNAEVLTAMGMAGRLGQQWSVANERYVASNRQATDVSSGFGAFSRSLRMMLQSAVLGVGAYLVIHGQATAGVIIAGSILVSRALAPIDLAIANWRGLVAARQGWTRLSKLLQLLPPQKSRMQLPSPRSKLSVEAATAVPPGLRKAVVQDVSLTIEAGEGLGIIGASGSGKSSLVRMLVGVWPPARGRVRLDGADLSQWSPGALGPHIGYLPQDVELFSGSVAENIARFDPAADSEGIIAAANAAGVHDLIVSLPDGYETELGEQGQALSAGQRQRIALARALYGNPFLVVLDEPNSNLDTEGEAALTKAILGVRERGGIVIVVAHRQSALAGVDLLLVMADGRAKAFGPKDELLSKAFRPKQTPLGPIRVVSGAGTNTS